MASLRQAQDNACLNCNRTEGEYPLLKLTYDGKELFICPQYLPILIHKPQNLVGKIPNFTPPSSQVESHDH